GGIGTASRVIPADRGGWTVGALVQTNFGRAEELIFAGIPVGDWLRPPAQPQPSPPERGSVIVVLATDAPLDSRQLHRLCVRAGAGLARTGSHIGHGSGDFVIAFSTARHIQHWAEALTQTATVLADEGAAMAGLFPGVVEAVEEAVLNSLCAATTITGRGGHVRYALPVEEISPDIR
ncbi:MAG: P1 family peptidase, partial [Caldilineaceae bacterium]